MNNRALAAPLCVLAALCGCNAIFGIQGAAEDPACAPARPAECAAEYLSDPDNCCVAGRSCGEGECVQGECTAALIAQGGSAEAISLTVSSESVFWTVASDRTVYRTDLDGHGKVTYPVPDGLMMQYVTRIAIDPGASPSYVYFTDYGTGIVGRAPVDGGDAVALAATSEAGLAARYGNVLVHGDHVYWAMQRESVSNPTDPGKDIWRAPREPKGELPFVAERVIEADRPLGLAADNDYLYFGESTANIIARVPWSALGEGAGLPVKGETVVQKAAQNDGYDIGEMAVDDEFIYWGSESVLWAQSKTDLEASSHTSVFTAPSYVGVIVADGDHVYFATLGDGDQTSGEVYRAARGGKGPTQRLYQGPAAAPGAAVQISSLAQDCGHLYFLHRGSCEVYKITK